MQKFIIKVYYTINVITIWYVLYSISLYVLDNVPINDNNLLIINICFIFSIFIILLPLSVFITHKIFNCIKRNY